MLPKIDMGDILVIHRYRRTWFFRWVGTTTEKLALGELLLKEDGSADDPPGRDTAEGFILSLIFVTCLRIFSS